MHIETFADTILAKADRTNEYIPAARSSTGKVLLIPEINVAEYLHETISLFSNYRNLFIVLEIRQHAQKREFLTMTAVAVVLMSKKQAGSVAWFGE